MISRGVFESVYLLAILLTQIPGAVARGDDVSVRVAELARPYVDTERVVGVSIGVIHSGKRTTVHLGSLGPGGDLPTDDTIYEIGSTSKVFTGILTADAICRGHLKLAQPIHDLLPPGTRAPVWKQRPITVLDLATHRSGLPRLADNIPMKNDLNPYADYSSELAYDFLSTHQLRRSPGDEYEYSNYGLALLGHLISEQAGGSYTELLTQRITEPLEMDSTGIVLSDVMQQRLATGHTAFGVPTSTWEFSDMPGAGGIRSSVGDMLQFAAAHLERPEGDVGKAVKLAWKRHCKASADGEAMGLGWHIAGDGVTRWHNGQTGGYYSMVLINRPLNCAVVVLANTGFTELDHLGQSVIRMLAGQIVKPRVFERSVVIAGEIMQRYVGRYELAAEFVFDVAVRDGRLMVGVTDQPTVEVHARSETEWFYKAVEASLRFQLDESGKCHALQLIQDGITQTANRIQ